VGGPCGLCCATVRAPSGEASSLGPRGAAGALGLFSAPVNVWQAGNVDKEKHETFTPHQQKTKDKRQKTKREDTCSGQDMDGAPQSITLWLQVASGYVYPVCMIASRWLSRVCGALCLFCWALGIGLCLLGFCAFCAACAACVFPCLLGSLGSWVPTRQQQRSVCESVSLCSLSGIFVSLDVS
jgi:hypothetical protein